MANSDVHTGLWLDWDHHPVLGATITLKTAWGQNLISAAAIVVQSIGIALWVILAYIIHQRRSTSGLRDEFDAQLQVLLRNCVGADGASWDILSLGRTWKGRRAKVWKTVGWISGLSAVIYAGFLVAGIFVGQISSNSYDAVNVLVAPRACGFINLNAGASGTAGYNNINTNVSTNAQQYARSCYGGGNIASAVSCSVYPVTALNYTVEMENQQCPIPGDRACFAADDAAAAPITLRTGVVNSHRHLGINARKEDRLSMQYETTCAPLDYDFVDSFKNTTNTTFKDAYFYPDQQSGIVELYALGGWSQADYNSTYTFLYSPAIRNWAVGLLGYSVNAINSYAPHAATTLSLWSPLAPFNQTSGDLSLITIMPNGITFTEPVVDPMFRTFDDPDKVIFGGAPYVPKRNVYMLACSEKWQICNVHKDKCTGWDTTMGLLDLPRWKKALNLNPAQNATYERMASTILDSNMRQAAAVPNPLLASYSLTGSTGSQALPNGHWRKEVEGWFQSVLSKWQFLPSVFVNIPLDLLKESNVAFIPANASGPEMEKQCYQQRVTAPQQYQSYNLFALVFIAFMGVLVPGIALFLKSSHRLGVGKRQDPGHLSYQAEGLLQLHRMALEGAGYKGWEDGVRAKPRTQTARKRLPQAVLEQEDADREPMLRYPRPGNTFYDRAESSSLSKERSNGYQEVSRSDDE